MDEQFFDAVDDNEYEGAGMGGGDQYQPETTEQIQQRHQQWSDQYVYPQNYDDPYFIPGPYSQMQRQTELPPDSQAPDLLQIFGRKEKPYSFAPTPEHTRAISERRPYYNEEEEKQTRDQQVIEQARKKLELENDIFQERMAGHRNFMKDQDPVKFAEDVQTSLGHYLSKPVSTWYQDTAMAAKHAEHLAKLGKVAYNYKDRVNDAQIAVTARTKAYASEDDTKTLRRFRETIAAQNRPFFDHEFEGIELGSLSREEVRDKLNKEYERGWQRIQLAKQQKDVLEAIVDEMARFHQDVVDRRRGALDFEALNADIK